MARKTSNSKIPLSDKELEMVDKAALRYNRSIWSDDELEKLKYLKYEKRVSPGIIYRSGIFRGKNYHQVYQKYKGI